MLWFHFQRDCKLLREYAVELRVECCWHSNKYCEFVCAQSCSKLSGNFRLLVACIHLCCTPLTWYIIINDSYCIRNRFEEELFSPCHAQIRYVALCMWRCACRHKQINETKHKTTHSRKKINKYLWVWMQTRKEESRVLAACNMQDMQNTLYTDAMCRVPCAVCTQWCNYENVWQNISTISQTQICMRRMEK